MKKLKKLLYIVFTLILSFNCNALSDEINNTLICTGFLSITSGILIICNSLVNHITPSEYPQHSLQNQVE